MTENLVFEPSAAAKERTYTTSAQYDELYARSRSDPDGFWHEQAQRIDWIKPFTKVKNTSFQYPDISIKWFEDGELNISANCIDRHLATRGDQVAIIWEGDTPGTQEAITYRKLHERVGRCANVLKSLGVKKGDRVTIYLPMIPQASYAMLACARIGAVHSGVFAGFSPDSLAGRINDCESNIVITADQGVRGGKAIPLKANVDEAARRDDVTTLERVLVVRHADADIEWVEGRDAWLHELETEVDAECPCEEMNAEDPLFILYTSGSTGKPKGVLHTTGGYLVYVAMTHEQVFDYRPGEVYWCTADE